MGHLWAGTTLRPRSQLQQPRQRLRSANPTISQWGIIALALLILTPGTVLLRRQPSR
ncbi:MAG: IPTL-CTERM sorting domain-containing protein [Phycisphaerales bacterium]|nr:MAG: IPTL-CTERM sorting domain-containing protein [Phycisphaerales bacterium]